MALRGIAESQKDLTQALGCSKGYVSRLVRQPWFPPRGESGWDVAACLAAIAENTRTGLAATPASGVPSVTAQRLGALIPPPATIAVGVEPDVATMLRSGSPIEVARASMRVAGAALASAVDTGKVSPREIDSLKKTLEELRRTEAGYLELGERRGELIERTTAAAVAAALARRFVEASENVEHLLAAQVEQWIDDATLRAEPAEDRRRRVRAWYAEQLRSVRETQAREIEAMIAEEIASA